MSSYKPVSISKASFAFCRYSIALLAWLSFFMMSKPLLGLMCVIFLASAIVKVRRSPMIRLYDLTFQKLHKKTTVMVNENAMFFAHLLGFALSFVCFLLVWFIDGTMIWTSVLAFSILKTISAFVFCPASKLYECTINGNCCVNKHHGTSNHC